jgi:predicted nucleotidyltransferase
MVRVSKYIRHSILSAVDKSFGDCEVVLFGSRVDDEKKGGDFDIAIKSDLSKEEFKRAKIRFFKELLLNDLDLPVDLISYKHANQHFKSEIDHNGILL